MLKKTRLLVATAPGELGKAIYNTCVNCRKWVVSSVRLDMQALIDSTKECTPDIAVIVPQSDTAGILPLVGEIVAQTPSLPILAVAVDNDSRLALRLIEAGASGYLLADSVCDELPGAVATVLAGRVYLSPGIAGVKRVSPAGLANTDSKPPCPRSSKTTDPVLLKDKEVP
jgi:DNA-binding NarL/FixJ family response regulator